MMHANALRSSEFSLIASVDEEAQEYNQDSWSSKNEQLDVVRLLFHVKHQALSQLNVHLITPVVFRIKGNEGIITINDFAEGETSIAAYGSAHFSKVTYVS